MGVGEEDAERGSRANERAHLGPHISGACGTKVVSCDEEEVEGGLRSNGSSVHVPVCGINLTPSTVITVSMISGKFPVVVIDSNCHTPSHMFGK